MNKVYIADAIRTPIGKYNGALSTIRSDDLMAVVLKEITKQNNFISANEIDEVIIGDGNQAGEDCRNIARMACLLADFPVSVVGNTVNCLCGSGMQAIMDGARQIMCGDAKMVIAGGVEVMSRAPYILPRENITWNKENCIDSTIGWRFTNQELIKKYTPYSQAETAELLSAEKNISREEQDNFAMRSHEKYFTALQNNIWEKEIVEVFNGKEKISIDEQPRKTSMELLQKLKPIVANGKYITAGNASAINDGAAAVLLADEKLIQEKKVTPLALIRGMATVGVHPHQMGIAPVYAINKLLAKTNLKISDIDLFEINESFACTTIACINDLRINEKIVNVNGGSIALGNSLGSSATRIVVTLLHELKRRKAKFGIASTSIGMGQGMAILLENIV